MDKLGSKVAFAFIFAITFTVAVYGVAHQLDQDRQNPMEMGAATITETDLRESLQLVAHKNLQGRGTADNGWEFPSLFLARELRKYGLSPKGDVGEYFQNFKVESNNIFSAGKIYLSRNVLGYLEGQNKDELVIIGAHYDHLGLGEVGMRDGSRGDVFYGADDNGSGTVALLEVAEAFGELAKKGIKPKRSIVFAFWGMEEYGEYGSLYYMRSFPEADRKNIIAYVNMDMVGRNDPKEVFLLCSPASGRLQKKCTELYDLAEAVNKDLKLEFQISHKDSEDGFERTDGWTFYKVDRDNQGKIPTFELFTGEHPDYHTPRDTCEKIDYKKLARVSKMAFGIAWKISEMNGRPAYKD